MRNVLRSWSDNDGTNSDKAMNWKRRARCLRHVARTSRPPPKIGNFIQNSIQDNSSCNPKYRNSQSLILPQVLRVFQRF